MTAEDETSGRHDDLEKLSHDMTESDSEPFLAKQTRPAANKIWWTRSAYFYILDVFLIAVTIVAFSSRPKHQQLQGDITGYVPAVGSRLVVFDKHPEFISNHSSEASLIAAREFWKTLVPPGQGFLDISPDTAERFNFPKLIDYTLPAKSSVTGKDRHGKSLGTSVVHSLHCLYTIMAEYDLLAQGQKPYSQGHMDHCFDYIRQVIMCGGDMALAGETFPGGSSQFGVTHICKNWDEIYDYLDKNRVSTEWQFGDAPTHFVPPT